MFKVVNNRKEGFLFHYAHFICDCLFPEIVSRFYKYKRIVREKKLEQTLGIFTPIYNEVMMSKTLEVDTFKFDKLLLPTITHVKKEEISTPKYFYIFRNYIFRRYRINPHIYNPNYPSVILIQRGNTKLVGSHIKDNNTDNTNLKNGTERREIHDIQRLSHFLQQAYGDQYKPILLENMPFIEQVKYFNNAKFIICAHGACMSNLFFCKKGTVLLEVTCDKDWDFFDVMTKILKINHYKCKQNNCDRIIRLLKGYNNIK